MSVAAMWFILGIILLAVELVSPVFVLFFFGLGAWAAGVTALQSRYFWGTAYKRSRNEKIPAACKASDRFFPIPVRDASSMIYSTETR